MSSTRVWPRSRRPASLSRSSSAADTSAPARHSGGMRWRGRSALRRPMQARSSSTSTARRARGRPAIGPNGTPCSVGSQRGFTRSLPRRSRARCGRSGNGRAPATCSPPASEDRPMTVDELRRLAASPLVTVESHGRGHACLATLPAERRAADLDGSARRHLQLAGTLARRPRLSIRCRRSRRRRSDTRRGARRGVFLRRAQRQRWSNDRMAIPRAAVGDVGADAFDAWLRKLAQDS